MITHLGTALLGFILGVAMMVWFPGNRGNLNVFKEANCSKYEVNQDTGHTKMVRSPETCDMNKLYTGFSL